MNITRLALNNNRTTVTLIVVLLLMGLQAFKNIPRAYDPGFIIRAAQVVTYFPGASPKRVEELISDPIEKVIQEIPELDFVKSESKTGVSIVTVNIQESYTNMRPIWDSLRRKMQKVAGSLPDGASEPEVNDEFGDAFGVVMALTGEGYNYAELKEVADAVKDELLRIDDVAKVDIHGVQDERVYIEYNDARLAELNLSPLQLADFLAKQNIVISGGSLQMGKERLQLEPSGNFISIEDIRRATISLPKTGEVVYLEDIVTIKRDYKEPMTKLVSSSGTPALAIAVSMREGGNNVHMGRDISEIIERFRVQLPIGVEIEMRNFSPQEVKDKVSAFTVNLLQSIIIVALVMLLTLGLRTGLVVSMLIPSSMIITILLMNYLSIGLDQISLAALIIALGMLVDNGIVMSESIMVEMQQGTSPMNAAIKSANELKIPLLTSSLTTSAAFLPIYLAESAMGEYTASLFQVVTLTLLCSWLLSLTMIPLLCVAFLKVKKENNKIDTFNIGIYPYYRRVLLFVLNYRKSTVSAVIVLFFVSIQAMQLLPDIFSPPSDRPSFKLEVELPIGSDIAQTQAIVADIENHLKTLKVSQSNPEGIRNWITYIGSGGVRYVLQHVPRPPSPEYAFMLVNTSGADTHARLMADIESYINAHHPDVQASARLIENGKAIANPVEIRIFGNDEDKLFSIVKQLKLQMKTLNGLKNVSDDWGQRIKKLTIDIDQEKARRAGITSQDIALSLQTGLTGYKMTEYREGVNSIPVILRTEQADREDIGKIESLTVFSSTTGRAVNLLQVADINIVWEAAKILRRDRSKVVSVGAQLNGIITAAEGFELLQPWLEQQSKNWLLGFYFEYGGEKETSGKSTASIKEKLPIAVFIIILLLVMQFNSLRKPVIILSTIPLGVIGVIWGLIIARSFFGFFTLLGIISLAGIVINNAIVLLERIKLEIDVNGLTPQQAIIEAGQRRMRPILLTTATTVMGLIPLYLGGGEMWEPMAVGIMAGLLFSTLLTLGFIPVLYSLFYRVNFDNFNLKNDMPRVAASSADKSN